MKGNEAIYAWIGLPILLTVYILGYDLWAEKTNHATMSAQIHVWMQSQLTGPIVVGLWFGISTALMYHFLINK